MKFRITTAVLAFTMTLTMQGAFASEKVIYGDITGPVLGHFQEDAAIIKECLTKVTAAELHFYWTTGRDISLMKFEYGANLHVNVGGAEYGQKFPGYVSALLACSPDNLKVKFVCDTMTYTSNVKWISSLIDQHGERFEHLDIHDVHANLLKNLSDQKSTIDSVFKNATGGNPAITSDGYRLFGMPLGRDLAPEIILKTQYTYCDVDAFCSGMDSPEGHTNLIKALFSEPVLKKPVQPKLALFAKFDPTIAFYLGRREEYEGKGNDLIKLSIKNLDAYKSFCGAVLRKMRDLEFKKKMALTSSQGVLTYFSELHSYIKECEKNPNEAFEKYLAEFSKNPFQVGDIIHVTGPGLLDNLEQCLPLDQEYPRTSAWEWHGTQLIEQGEGPLESIDYEDSGDLSYISPEYIANRVHKEFKQYALRVSDAFFAKRFGENHPFNMKMVDYLRIHSPYTTESFKTLMEKAYGYQRKTRRNFLDSEGNWLDSQVILLTKRPQMEVQVNKNDPYYVRLNHLLKQLEIDIPLTRGTIDFRT